MKTKFVFLLAVIAIIVVMLTACGIGCKHESVEWLVDSFPSCDSEGQEISVCLNCGDIVEARLIPTNEHRFDEGVISSEPTCTSFGINTRHCLDCGMGMDFEIEKIDHVLDEWEVRIVPTCSSEGERIIKCTVCQQTVKSEIIQKALHNEGEWITTVSETCTTDGISVKQCLDCNEILGENKIPAHHNESILAAVSPSCTKPGLTEGSACSACGQVLVEQQEIPVTNHSFETVSAVAPKCNSYGYTEGVQCKSCKLWEKEPQKINKLQHTVVNDAPIEATCTSTGKTAGTHCSSCKEVIVAQKSTPKLEHDFSVYSNNCSKCQAQGYHEIRTVNDLRAYNHSNYDAIIYLDYCVNVQETNVYWTLTLGPETNYLRLVGTPGVKYNFRIVVDPQRKNPIKIDLVDAYLKTLVDKPIIESTSSVNVQIGLYGEYSVIRGKDGDVGKTGGVGGNGSIGILSAGSVNIVVGVQNCEIIGGSGGKGGKGADRFAMNAGNGGNGGNGTYAISANSITVEFEAGFTRDNIVIMGGSAGAGGAGGEASWLYKDGKAGSPGKGSSATTTPVVYR